MSKIRPNRDFLLDIEDAIGRILDYTAGMKLKSQIEQAILEFDQKDS